MFSLCFWRKNGWTNKKQKKDGRTQNKLTKNKKQINNLDEHECGRALKVDENGSGRKRKSIN